MRLCSERVEPLCRERVNARAMPTGSIYISRSPIFSPSVNYSSQNRPSGMRQLLLGLLSEHPGLNLFQGSLLCLWYADKEEERSQQANHPIPKKGTSAAKCVVDQREGVCQCKGRYPQRAHCSRNRMRANPVRKYLSDKNPSYGRQSEGITCDGAQGKH